MRDAIIEEILRQQGEKKSMMARPRVQKVIPSANRYPHSAVRAKLERERQPCGAKN